MLGMSTTEIKIAHGYTPVLTGSGRIDPTWVYKTKRGAQRVAGPAHTIIPVLIAPDTQIVSGLARSDCRTGLCDVHEWRCAPLAGSKLGGALLLRMCR